MAQSPQKNQVNNAKPLIIAGFSSILILILMILLIGFWSKSLSDNKHLLSSMASITVQTRLITKLFNTVYQQTVILNQINKTQDTTKKEIGYAQYLAFSKILSSSYTELDAIKFNREAAESWHSIQQQFIQRHNIEKISADTHENGEHATAYEHLINNIPPLQNRLMNELSALLNKNLLNRAGNSVDDIINEATHKIATTYFFIYLLGGISIFLGIFTIYILKRTESTEAALIAQGKRIQWLYEATSRSGISLDDRITETLKLGCRVLGMEIGKLGRQFPEKNESVFLNTVAPPELPAKRGLILPLDKTFCNITFSADGPIAIQHVSKSSYKDHPAAEFLGMEAYIGTTIYVHDKKFGTVNFSNRQPMEKSFTQTDIDFVNLLGKWISVTMEQIIIEDELQQSKDEAEAANHAKTAFLANMSHEIRTPLTAILGYSEMLLDDDQSQEEMEHEINSIITSGKHLQQIINDILDLSKIEAGQLIVEYQDVSLSIFMDELDAILGSQVSEKGLSFDMEYHFPIPGTIHTDPTRLKQILLNLCGNAIKFTQEGSISISIQYLSDSNQMQITVADTGIGISEQEQKKIFSPFTQADNSTTRIYGGTGLGLCISKQLAKTLGGDITVTSETGMGSEFTITIDVCIEKNKLEMINTTPVQEPLLSNQSAHQHIQLVGHLLLVEDNPENQRLITKSIRKIGLTVDTVENGKAGVEKALSGNYNLVLMDMQMPVMSGLEAIRKLRAQGDTVPIISITANAMQEDKSSCLAAGADNYLTKPLDFGHFYEVLSTYLVAREQ